MTANKRARLDMLRERLSDRSESSRRARLIEHHRFGGHDDWPDTDCPLCAYEAQVKGWRESWAERLRTDTIFS